MAYNARVSPERRDKIQQLADNLHVPVYVTREGSIKQLKPGDPVPDGAELFRPRYPWHDAPHGGDPPGSLAEEPA